VILHGLNMVDKFSPYRPDALGFGADDARFLARNGFDSVRLGIIWKGLEPKRGHFDERYLGRVVATARLLERHGILPVIDFHQDMWNERYQGEGAPDWALQDDGQATTPRLGFPINYVAMPALSAAMESFFANRAGIQDAYGAAWRHVAARFKGDRGIVAFDIFNEPWPGAKRYARCVTRAGCSDFDRPLLGPFNRRILRAIRKTDKRRLLAYEPNVAFNNGARTYVGDTDDARALFDFHVYCADDTPGVAKAPTADATCPAKEDLPFAEAARQQRLTGDATLVTEFGATDELARIASVVNIADRRMVGWEEWAYWNADPSAPRPIEGLIHDIHQPPAGANVKRGKLRVLARPYPRAVAGVPTAWSFAPSSRKFALRYGKIRRKLLTEVVAPRLQYPKGYRVSVRGARVRSRANAPVLLLAAKRAAGTVTVTLRPR
jgi:endoglycosylceramidase